MINTGWGTMNFQSHPPRQTAVHIVRKDAVTNARTTKGTRKLIGILLVMIETIWWFIDGEGTNEERIGKGGIRMDESMEDVRAASRDVQRQMQWMELEKILEFRFHPTDTICKLTQI